MEGAANKNDNSRTHCGCGKILENNDKVTKARYGLDSLASEE